MAKKKKPRKGDDVPASNSGTLKSNPFGALAGLSAPRAPNAADVPTATSGDTAPTLDAAPPGAPNKPSRVIVSYQRKGRGGKEVTLIELRGVAEQDLAGWLSQIKKALGCGGFVESPRLAVTGDQRQRLQSFFTARGVDRITVG